MKTITEDEARERLRAHIKKHHKTQKAFAKKNDVTPAAVCSVLKGRRPLPQWMLSEIGHRRTEIIYQYQDHGNPGHFTYVAA